MEVPLSQPHPARPAKTTPLKPTRRRRAAPATYEDLSRRLGALADDALRLGYPFTAEHLIRLAKFVVKDESIVAMRIADSETAMSHP